MRHAMPPIRKQITIEVFLPKVLAMRPDIMAPSTSAAPAMQPFTYIEPCRLPSEKRIP